ncbi:aldehyde dehydrogenase family protein [Streptoalloteichus hindustanus]|uniref:Betaine-aldehyde dehydrogenase n=1 Tax=Streptoalloteichus hindustanus TaxID=2017 RepID=A0A1M5HBM9_STRHI|nr:aldehyde dehydrogenase family protein [Streptoalloteichus hindustanus]SHG13390.1 betaine-aldehyde dehydrogenase [Streptoalloteichus hindustanus]
MTRTAGTPSGLLIDGRWTNTANTAGTGGTREVRCPHDDRVVAVVAEATAEDVRAAVAAARRAFDSGPWPALPAAERGEVVTRIGELVREHTDELAELESLDTGKPLADSRQDMADVAAVFRYYGGLGPALSGRTVEPPGPDVASEVVREPVGVCAQITPWNYPLLQASWKLAPALAAGCTVVLKPSELTPLTTLRLAELAAPLLPPGVLNVVLGAGDPVGRAMVTDADVDMVSFTGGLATGRRIMADAAATVKKVALELGGKNPNVVFADADFDAAVDNALSAAFFHAGQVCSAGARLLVQRELHQRFVAALVDRVGEIRLGDGFSEKVHSGQNGSVVHCGPLISRAHREKVAGLVEATLAEGAVLRAGGRPPEDAALADGWYYLPTVLDGCRAEMTAVREEVFGPVMTVEVFDTEDEAVAMANDTVYGLAGAVWTGDAGRARRVARRLRHGTVWINDYHPYVPQAEWGGFKQSGVGRELGPTGLEEYTEAKHVYHNLRPARSGWLAAGGGGAA